MAQQGAGLYCCLALTKAKSSCCLCRRPTLWATKCHKQALQPDQPAVPANGADNSSQGSIKKQVTRPASPACLPPFGVTLGGACNLLVKPLRCSAGEGMQSTPGVLCSG